jgi:membrane protease YdiL (CAAX protease family)
MRNSFYIRMTALTLILVVMALCNQWVLLSVSWIKGIELSNKDAFLALLDAPENLPLIKMAIGSNHILMFILGPIIYIRFFYSANYSVFLRLQHFNPILLWLFPMALFALYPLMGYLTFYIAQWDLPALLDQMDQESMEIITKIITMKDPVDFAVNLILVGVLPAVGEELLFRGIIQQELVRQWKKNHAAIWTTSLLFAAFHFQIVGFLPKLMIGLMLGYALHYGRSLWLPILLHFMNNSLTLWGAYLSDKGMETSEITEKTVPLAAVIISFFIFGWLMYYIRSVSLLTNAPVLHDEK